MKRSRHSLAALLAVGALASSCTLTPESCDPLIPDIGAGKALGCWISGNTQANLDNMRREIETLAAQIELQALTRRQIETSSARLAGDVERYRRYIAETDAELESLRERIAGARADNERERVTRDALGLELTSLRRQLALARNDAAPSSEEIARLQEEVSRKRSAIEAMTSGILIE